MSQINVTYIDHCGSDLTTVNAARVSFGKKSEWDQHLEDHISFHKCVNTLSERDTKLIKYLAKHKHLSPFGHAFASFHVKAPIFMARQLVKHKFLRWNEVSRRYVDEEPEFYVPEVWRGRSADKKQGSEGVVTDMVFGTQECSISDGYGTLLDYVADTYGDLIKAGVAPEQARMVLPQSTMTEWYWSGSLDAFADMCRLRFKSDTQEETRRVAEKISLEMKALFPVSWEALLKDYGDT